MYMLCESPYVLPTIEFVGGETQDLSFNVYFYQNRKPYSLTSCTCEFSIVHFRNKTGEPVLTKMMDVAYSATTETYNVLTVTLNPMDTVDLAGKYIYQISIRDVDGDVEIPKQGILYITNNIDKDFIRS